MLLTQPHPLISVLVITAAVLITYPLAVKMTDALRPLMEDFLDRRDARRYEWVDFEKTDHLVVTPPNGTPVILVADSDYLRRSLGIPRGRRGTVIRPTNLNPEDDGVLVDWGVVPNDYVRMDLNELRLAPDA